MSDARVAGTVYVRALAVLGLCVLLPACGGTDFIKRSVGRAEPEPVEPVTFQVTPRELLTARLENPPADENSPRVTVGKLIEFADRYLSCDCSGTRFVRSWQRTADGYVLQTNSEQIRPLEFACRGEEEATSCFLREIDRGAHVTELEKRFVPGAEFIQFMYENGLKCDREGPCPISTPAQ